MHDPGVVAGEVRSAEQAQGEQEVSKQVEEEDWNKEGNMPEFAKWVAEKCRSMKHIPARGEASCELVFLS